MSSLAYVRSVPVLKTKLYAPPVRTDWVSRPRLLARLQRALHVKLALLSAPAGFGKTTLLSAWIAGCEAPTAWLSLDRDDNDPARFWGYVVAALILGALYGLMIAFFTSVAFRARSAGSVGDRGPRRSASTG